MSCKSAVMRAVLWYIPVLFQLFIIINTYVKAIVIKCTFAAILKIPYGGN